MPFQRHSKWETNPKIGREMRSQSFSRVHLLKFRAASRVSQEVFLFQKGLIEEMALEHSPVLAIAQSHRSLHWWFCIAFT
ncbi:MAG: hypothetical protein CMI15_08395 [Opitutaceae bacterium]|nr:hypothetical protein [Opitutaceae bacterium]